MGKLKSALEDWLDDIGYSLGYYMENYPYFSQWEKIKIKRIYRRKYGRQNKDEKTRRCS